IWQEVRMGKAWCSVVAIISTLALSSCCHKPVVPVLPSSVGSQPTSDKAFNLQWKNSDYNSLPGNPYWHTQASQPDNLPVPPGADKPPSCQGKPFESGCTDNTGITTDRPVFPNSAICGLEFGSNFHGHANWTPADYSGTLAWWNFATDWDYNLAVIPP